MIKYYCDRCNTELLADMDKEETTGPKGETFLACLLCFADLKDFWINEDVKGRPMRFDSNSAKAKNPNGD